MPLLDGPSLGGNARHVLRQYAEESALARGRAANAAGTEEFGGGCLRGRYNNLREVIQNNPSLVVVPSIINSGSLFVQRPICRTNYLPNNSMAGATGGVLPTNWSIASLPAGITISYSASGTAVATDGTSVNYIDVTVSGTAGASGFLNIRPNPSSSTIAAFVGQSWNTSVYLQLISGSVASISPTWQLQELNSSQTFLQGSNIGGLGSLVVGGQFQRYNVSRVLTDSATAFVTCRWGHSFVSGTTYSYTLRIGSPQLERFSVPTPMIATSTGAVTRLNESTNVVGLPPDFTVSRNTGATRVGPNGLIEAGNTNLALQSEAFDVSGTWVTTTGGTGVAPIVTQATGIVDPAGGTTAERIQLSVGSGTLSTDFSILRQTATFTAVAHTFSVYLRSATSGSQFVAIRFNSAPQTILEITPSWQRFTFTGTPSAGSRDFGFDLRGNNTSASGSADFYAWGAQVEVGSTASEYIPTTTVARTRFAGVTVDGTIAANIPRIDWLGQSCPALLVEASGQNVCLHSEVFNNAFHFPFNLNAFGSGSVANTTATLDPYGTNVADYIQENSASGVAHSIIDVFAGNVSGTTYTWSVFAKAAERTIINLFNNGGGGGSATFNLTTGVATLIAGVSASMQNYGNGWWRCILTYTSTTTGNHNVQIRLCDASGNASYNGTGNQGAYIFGAQLEVGSVATTYIPTTVAAASRAADTIRASGALVSGLIGQTEGTIYAEVDVRNANVGVFLAVDDGDNSDFILIFKDANLAIAAQIRRASGAVVTIITSSPVAAGVHKVALGYKNGDYALYIDGVSAGTSTNSTNYPATSLTRCVLSSTTPEYVSFNDRIRATALYTTRLSNDQLAELTRL